LILIAEDVIELRTVLGDLLIDEGYRVHVASDGQEALDLFAQEIPAVIVSNISMPHIDGITLVHRIREGGYDVPVILISAEVAPVNLPGVVLIAKPFDLDAIMDAVEQSLAGA